MLGNVFNSIRNVFTKNNVGASMGLQGSVFGHSMSSQFDYLTELVLNNRLINEQSLSLMYRKDAIVRRIVDDWANESTKRWREWKSQDDNIDLQQIEELEQRLEVRSSVNQAIAMSRLFGGAYVFMDVTDGRDMSQSINWNEPLLTIRNMKAYPQSSLVQVDDTLESTHIKTQGGNLIHKDRVIILRGIDLGVLGQWKQGGMYGGMMNEVLGQSVVAPVLKSIEKLSLIEWTMRELLSSPFVDIYKIDFEKYAKKGLTPGEMKEAMLNLNDARMLGSRKANVVDVGDSFETQYREYNGLVELRDSQFNRIAIDMGMPKSRLLGEAVGGLSAGADDEARKYYDRIIEYQKNELDFSLRPLNKIIVHILTGDRNSKDVWYEWLPLWEEKESEKLAIEIQKQQLLSGYVGSNIMTTEEARQELKNSKHITSIYK